MNIIECIGMAFSSIKVNKMRSFLTMLGIIIGISSVITITTIGNSIQETLSNTFNKLGTNSSFIMVDQKDYSLEETPTLTKEDEISEDMLNGLIEKYPDQFKIIQENYYSDGKVLNENNNYVNVNIKGATDGFFEDNKFEIIKGRAITHRDNLENKYTAVVSDIFVNQYFKDQNVLGKTIVVSTSMGESLELTIVGVYKYSEIILGRFDAGIREQDKVTPIYIPYNVVQTLKNKENEAYAYCSILWNIDMGMDSAEKNLKSYFDKFYENNEYWTIYIESDQSSVDMINKVMDIVTIAISFIAAISLFVGGIGVMNIMLVSIVERTNEIGIRKALGAQNSSIRLQFVTESIIICIVGGVIGIIIGLTNSLMIEMIGANYINSMYEEYTEIIQITIQPSVKAILISIISSTLVGLIFGYYPANRAAKMNPIDALRHD